MANERTRPGKVKRKAGSAPSPVPPITQEAVARLEKLAVELESASKEAGAVAAIVRTDLADELSTQFVHKTTNKKI